MSVTLCVLFRNVEEHWVQVVSDFMPALNAKPQLYNLVKDIGKTKIIAAASQEILKELDQLRTDWAAELMDPAFLRLIHTDAWKKKTQPKKYWSLT